MLDLFNMGGPLFMGLLTITGIAALVVFVLAWMGSKNLSSALIHGKVGTLKSIGTFALILGILGQLLGLYDAFSAIEQMGSISPAMLAGGIKISSITTIYGMIIFLLTYLLSFALGTKDKG